MQDLLPAKSNRTKGDGGGGYGSQKEGEEPAFWVPAPLFTGPKLLFYYGQYICTYEFNPFCDV